MNRKKYIITIKMIKVINMEHEQMNIKNAKEDVKNIIENSNNEYLNKIFNSEPRFIYKVKKI